MKIFLAIFLFVAAANLFTAEKTSYTGYKLYSVTIPDQVVFEYIHLLEDNDPEVLF